MAVGFLATLILLQIVLFFTALLSLAIPILQDFFYFGNTPTLAFWIFVGIGMALLGLTTFANAKRSKAAYIASIIAGFIFGLLFSVALISIIM
jgi:hypothetical protein